jgi:hypothetical protein
MIRQWCQWMVIFVLNVQITYCTLYIRVVKFVKQSIISHIACSSKESPLKSLGSVKLSNMLVFS